MTVTLIKDSGQYSIPVSKVEWSGSASQASRELSFDLINAPNDSFDIPKVSTGDFVSFSYNGEEVFYGQIFGVERSSNIGTITYTAYDMMKNLLESTGQCNFKNLTAEGIAKQVLDDMQIPIRHLHPTGVNIPSLLCDDKGIYEIIMGAYTKAHQVTKDKYFPMIYKRGFAVYKTEWSVKNFILSETDNLMSASLTETMENIVNRIKIYDEKGNQIGELKDDNSIKKYGVFQKIFKKEEKDTAQSANALMNIAPKQEIKISAIGDINCLSCYFVDIKDSATGLNGKYWISADRHRFDGETYTMDLDLRFDSVMDEKKFEDRKEEKREEEKKGADKNVGKRAGKSTSKRGSGKGVKVSDNDKSKFFKTGKIGVTEGGYTAKPTFIKPIVRKS